MSQDARSSSTPTPAAARGEGPVSQFVGFRLGDEDYAIAITKIQEIILMKPITRLPQAPDYIEGMINLRGAVIPVVNLRKRFGLPVREVDDETRTIVVNVQERTVGCVVDAVTRVMRLNREQIQPSPLGAAGESCRYVSGLARLDERLLIVLDVEKLFQFDDPTAATAS